MAVYAEHTRKIRGIVLDGPIRDVDELSKMEHMFLYATGSTPGGPYKEGPGEINVPISVGNIAVNPGDIVLGDADGVIIIPRKDADKILETAIPFAVADAGKVDAARTGKANRQWVADTLEKKGVEIIDDVYHGKSPDNIGALYHRLNSDLCSLLWKHIKTLGGSLCQD